MARLNLHCLGPFQPPFRVAIFLPLSGPDARAISCKSQNSLVSTTIVACNILVVSMESSCGGFGTHNVARPLGLRVFVDPVFSHPTSLPATPSWPLFNRHCTTLPSSRFFTGLSIAFRPPSWTIRTPTVRKPNTGNGLHWNPRLLSLDTTITRPFPLISLLRCPSCNFLLIITGRFNRWWRQRRDYLLALEPLLFNPNTLARPLLSLLPACHHQAQASPHPNTHQHNNHRLHAAILILTWFRLSPSNNKHLNNITCNNNKEDTF